ncbi:MAG: site-specific DNA-methyltransferase [Ignavibacteriaceae bacterium]|nr:site-specific DNA-methyltransferase [Ignavibacteriaceae bacterium]
MSVSNYDKLIDVLNEVFMLDKAELDFGIYRILNQKRNDIQKFLTQELIPQVKETLNESLSIDTIALEKELEEAIKQAAQLGADPDSLPRVKELKARLAETGDLIALENEIFSLLTTFFKRYFDTGDFISKRRYKKDVYAIPYEGEEVKLHWANSDQYYIKTSEYLKNYRFTLSNGKIVSFELVEATTEQNNNKTQGDKERRFALYSEKQCYAEGDNLTIFFTYDLQDKKIKQADLLAQTFDTLKAQIPKGFEELLSTRPTEKDKHRTLLQKHLTDYTARNTFDYFIHKDLGGFLNRELDFFIKNEVLFIDDLNTKSEQEFLKQLGKIKALKRIAQKIIAFLAQIENFQKKLWLKKKMVIECNYCITLDRVPAKLYPEICNNQEQINEWINLYKIDEIAGKESDDLFPDGKEVFSKPVTIEFLKQNSFLLLDTALFSEDFKWRLLQEINDIDGMIDGLLIKSFNFNALRLLLDKYEKKIKGVYIDPPYNTDSNSILYKNTFRHSSWLSLIMPNLLESQKMEIEQTGVHVIAIDKAELSRLMLMLEDIWTEKLITPISIIHNPGGTMGKNFSGTSEFAIFIHDDKIRVIAQENREEDPDIRELMNTAKGKTNNYLRSSGRTCFYPILVKNNKVVGFGDVCLDNYHPPRNILRDDGVIEVYPIDNDNVERKWVLSRETVEECIGELFVKLDKSGVTRVYRAKSEINFKTCWTKSEYSAKKYGTEVLGDIMPITRYTEPLYPKSIHLVEDCIYGILNYADGIILDYFAGSGTTAHAVINLNRNDNGKRKYILVEMGEYFDTVTKPRVQKVIYSKDWKDGKPVSREGISHCFKYMTLESYEDTLNNLVLKQTDSQQAALEVNTKFKEGYMLNYMLDFETEGSLLTMEWFEDPFNNYLNITKNNETKPVKVDLIETFNYLIGLTVINYALPKDGFRVVTGVNRENERILVVWRDCKKHNGEALNQFLLKSKYNPLDGEFDRIYVNGDNNVENIKTGDERWKVVLIEEEFKKRMFDYQ